MNPHSFVRRTTALLLLSVSVPVLAEPAGSLDPTFDSDGKQTVGFDDIAQQGVESTDDVAYAMALAPGGRIYLAGVVRRSQDGKAIGLTRLKHDGSLDTSFGNEGRVVHDAVDGVSVVLGSALQPDGKLVVAGWAKNEGGGAQAMACRFEQDGAPDTNFGAPETPGCRLFPEESMSNYHASAVAIQADGRIVLAGSKTGRAMLARLHTDGTIDTAFGNMGTYQPGAPHLSSGFRDVTQMPDGDLVAAGHTNLSQQNGDHDILLVRLDQANGEPDLAFAPNGIKVFSISQSIEVKRRSDSAGSVHALPDGSLLLTGETRTDYSYDAAFSSRPFAMRLLPNGQYDQGFGGGKRIYYPCPLQQ